MAIGAIGLPRPHKIHTKKKPLLASHTKVDGAAAGRKVFGYDTYINTLTFIGEEGGLVGEKRRWHFFVFASPGVRFGVVGRWVHW